MYYHQGNYQTKSKSLTIVHYFADNGDSLILQTIVPSQEIGNAGHYNSNSNMDFYLCCYLDFK